MADSERHQTLPLWLGAAMLTLVTAAVGIALYQANHARSNLWLSPWMIVAYVLLCGAFLCFAAAVRGPLGGRPVPDAHRAELQSLAEGLKMDVMMQRPARYQRHTSELEDDECSPAIARAFRAHFPGVAELLDKWSEMTARHPTTREAVTKLAHSEVTRRTKRRYAAPDLVIAALIEYDGIEFDGTGQPRWSLNDDGILALCGLQLCAVSSGQDVESVKMPITDALRATLASGVAWRLRFERVAVEDHRSRLLARLDEIQHAHVIRGRCDLCN
jgi:hypothetical protein